MLPVPLVQDRGVLKALLWPEEEWRRLLGAELQIVVIGLHVATPQEAPYGLGFPSRYRGAIPEPTTVLLEPIDEAKGQPL